MAVENSAEIHLQNFKTKKSEIKNLKIKDIEIENLSFSYGGKPVFQHFSACLKSGKRTALMAASGTGKTTLLHLIAGLLIPSGGQISYPVPKPRFSFVFQENRLLENSSAAKNLRLVNPALTPAQIHDAFMHAGLPETCGQKKVRFLSGGEQRRISLLRALLAEYDILLLDEPFTGLDETTKEQLLAYVKASTEGKTVLFATHNEKEAEMLCCEPLRLSDA